MPFAKTSETRTEEYWTEHYNSFLKPIIEEVTPVKAHRSAPMRGDILKEIIKDLIHTDIVVADLTDSNPNVFWELGVRQSFKHGTITIAQEGTRLPFDISSKGTLFYSNKNHLKSRSFIREFKQAIRDCIKNPNRPDSIVLETLTGRGTIQEISRKDEIERRLEALNSEYLYNYDKFNHIVRVMRANQRKKKPGSAIRTDRLRSASIELFIANRYLSSSKPLYITAESYLDKLNMINGQLMIWETHANVTELWFLNQVDNWRKEFKTFLKSLINETAKFKEKL